MSDAPVSLQGTTYIIKPNDYLRKLAVIAYGDEMKWTKIWNANTFRSGNSELIFPGEVIYIPKLEETKEAERKIKENAAGNRGPGTVMFMLGGREVLTKQGRFACGFDVMASSWNADIAWNPEGGTGDDKHINEQTARRSFAESELYLGNELAGTGLLYSRRNKISKDGIEKHLECYSKTKDLVDTSWSTKFAEIRECTLKYIAGDVCGALGYGVEFEGDPGKPFKYIQGLDGANAAGEVLQKIAAQVGFFIDCTPGGDVRFRKFPAAGAPVADLFFGAAGAEEFSVTFDDGKLFNSYMAHGQSGDGKPVASSAKDDKVPKARQLVFKADECDADTIINAAAWRMTKALLDAYSFSVPVSDWYDDNGNLWKPAATVNFKSPVLDVPDAKKFIIRQVEFEWSASGRGATLTLVPPFEIENGELKGEWA
jgi:prophage tail gpP-like protein